MKRSLLFMALFFFSVTAILAQSASLSGKVSEKANNEPVLFGTVALYQNGVLKGGTETDFDGNYSFSNLDPGTYAVEFSYLGLATQRVEGVQVFAGKAITVNAELDDEGVLLDLDVVVVEYRIPLVEQDNTTQGGTLTSDQIRSLPTRNINALAATTAGLSSSDEGEDVSIRGSRDNATNYYVDGIRVQGNLIPESEIEQLQVITGGVEARYGDVTGGIISITTKGPSSEFSGGIEAETSQYLDAFDNSLVGVNLSGPILKNKEGQSVLGFRLAGRYTDRVDDDPSAVPVYRVKDDVLQSLQDNPVITRNGAPFVAADFLTNEDVNALEQRPFENYTRYDLTGKLDARFSEAIDVTLTGAYSISDDLFTPNENSATQPSWRLLNAHRNPLDEQDDYRVNFRFRHRLGGATSGEGDDRKVSTVQNATYTLQLSYEQEKRDYSDPVHGHNYFDYGYVGKFDVENIPVFQVQFDTATLMNYLVHADYREVLRGYDTSNSPNPVLANYNNPFGLAQDETINPGQPGYAIQGFFGENANTTIDNLYAINGRVSNIFSESWNFHANVGSVYNNALKNDDETIVFNANAAFDLVPGGSENGRHNIQIGIAYEQRTNREYFVRDPRRLWTTARQNANSHIQGIDLENADTLGMYSEIYGGELVEFIDAPILSLTLQDDPDSKFYKAVRDELGMGYDEFLNVDGLTPDQLRLDMFSAKELNDQFILDYYGHDYLGNEFDGTFEEFFTATDADGLRTFPVAPNRPLYASAFIQDKFTFRDIIFRLGVRVDRYDANAQVLQDPYSLYAIQGANDFHANNGGVQPGNIGDDFRVYTETDDGDKIQAYRDGDDWFHADGSPANGPNEVEGIRTGLVFPKYENPNAHEANYIKSEDYDPDASFQSYEVQFNVMPRLAFSFPISDKANFFAHYDILVQRPPSNTITTALDYFYFVERANQSGVVYNNSNLLPERTVDYEVGFQQRLSTTSAVKISAYYKEMRDMIQRRTFFPVPIVGSYTTYDNQDFGTVKGFSFGYDMRRTNNLTLNANYTLQFADGTGSDANSQQGLTNNGNLRTLFPLNFDERHRLNLVADYRYGQEEGPRVGGTYIFANTGLNVQAIGVSGRPYTAKQTAQELGGTGTVGSINGARKPWNFTINLRLDRNIKIGNNLGLNVYVRVSNVLDRRNTINVYTVTGSPTDDGFLRSSFGQDQIAAVSSSTRELQSYLASYQWRLLNPDYFSLPRRIFVGAIMDF